MTDSTIFSLENVNVSFGVKHILTQITLEISSGDFFVITGPSGGGKTTLLRLLNGLAPQDAGKILYRGNNVQNGNLQSLRKEVGLVFQNPVVMADTVKENLLVRQKWDKSFTISDEQLMTMMDRVGIPQDHLHLDARSLSGGEKQRIALARTMLNEPKVLLLDEPTANLDQQLAGQILDMVSNLQMGIELTIVMVCHNIQQVVKHANRAAFLIDGVIAESGLASILENPTTQTAQRFLQQAD